MPSQAPSTSTPAPQAKSSSTPATSLLPSSKTKTGLDPSTAKVLLYGPPKIGKSTLASKFDSDHALFLACEPGLGGLDVFQVPISSWADFRAVGSELAQGDHRFKMVVVDTIDELVRYCTEDVLAKLGVAHASDAAYGKGWAAINDEFRLRISKLASLGLGIWFVSHAEDKKIEQRVGTISKTVPTVGGKARDFIIGFVDCILLATSIQTEEGDQRVLRTRSTENYEAGCRGGTLPDPLKLDAGVLRQAMERAWA